MRLLLDTHCWLWLVAAPERIRRDVVEMLVAEGTDVYISAATAWEIVIKHALGKLSFPSRLPNTSLLAWPPSVTFLCPSSNGIPSRSPDFPCITRIHLIGSWSRRPRSRTSSSSPPIGSSRPTMSV